MEDNDKDKEFKRIERLQYAYCGIILLSTICTLIFAILIIIYGNNNPMLDETALFAYGFKKYWWLLLPDCVFMLSLFIH